MAEELIRRNAAIGMIVQDINPPMVDLILHNPHGHGQLPWAECCKLASLEGTMVANKVTNKVATKGSEPEVAALLGEGARTGVVVRPRTATVEGVPVRLDAAIYPLALVCRNTDPRRREGARRHLRHAGQAGHSPAARTNARCAEPRPRLLITPGDHTRCGVPSGEIMVRTLISASAGDIMPEGAVELAESGLSWHDLPEHAQTWATEQGYGESEHELLYMIPNDRVWTVFCPTL